MSMTFRAISADNDWKFGQGAGSYFKNQEAIAANVKTSLLFFLNDCFFAMTTGIDWWNLLGAKNPAAEQNILLNTRKVIANCYGVTKIASVRVAFDSLSRSLQVFYTVDTIFSRNVTGFVQLP